MLEDRYKLILVILLATGIVLMLTNTATAIIGGDPIEGANISLATTPILASFNP